MPIDFGNIQSYKRNRGFGFVSCRFSIPYRTIFFHITKIEEKYPDLAQKLGNKKEVLEDISFWYEIETTRKGKQVKNLWLDSQSIPKDYENELAALIKKTEEMWKNINSPLPFWLNDFTKELLGTSVRDRLNNERNDLIEQSKKEKEQRKQEILRFRESEVQRIYHKYFDLTEPEARELEHLLLEMRPLGFKFSADLSKYIVRKHLGYKYQHISGILRMSGHGSEWDFDGGFPPRIYKIICEELDLDNWHTEAVPVKFTPFKDIL
ncbi:hypothetical protein NIES970_04320 [[Synechococcus] sp. NIES-970]|nr:hypothetical protein NIES970_04320 [[Synechococcus] sp. NIES-970]